MPRYFTSPPPVYARNWANGQNLVESTKIERPIIESKKVRKEKKERKREKKQRNEKTIEHLYLPTKQVCDESEQQLERSCLTEEHEKYLSDGSQDSKKRRRDASPSVESNIKAKPVTGNPLRIRFVFKKPKEAEVVVPQVPQEDLVCSTSGTDRPSKEVSSSVSGHEENLLPASLESDETAILSESKKKKKHKTSKESRYSSLFDEPVVPCIPMEEDSSNSDDDWLLSTRRQEEKTSTKSTMNEDIVMMNLQKSGESCFPSSQFLPEAGIFSLPYTVLF